MKIAVCDDITEYRLSVKRFADEYFRNRNISISTTQFKSGNELLSSDENFDILFLDIELGDSNGIDIAKEIQKRNKNTVILIITSYRQYLDAAMDLKVTRYIDKPLTQERIYSALDKALSQISENIITLHTKNKSLVRIRMNDIVYVEAKLKSVTVYTTAQALFVKEPLKDLRCLLTADYFAVPHNSFIVNMNFIKVFKRKEIHLIEPYDKITISTSTRKQKEFQRRFFDFIGESNND